MEGDLLVDNEEREVNEIDGILPLLFKKGLLTDIECRIIISATELTEKQGAVYRVILSRSKEEAENLTEIFRTLTVKMYSEEQLKSQNSDLVEAEPNFNEPSLVTEKNPLLNNTVIKILFGYLPLKDIKNSRLVCSQWNSTAEILLRKRSRINFRPDILLPETFLKFSKYSLPHLPFSSFKFSMEADDNYWQVSEVQEFFDHWGKNIKEVLLNELSLISDPSLAEIPTFYDMSPLFVNACNITSLYIRCTSNLKPLLTISWGALAKFTGLKSLVLVFCKILIEPETQNNRIVSEQIQLHYVRFIGDGKMLTRVNYNAIFDFSKSTHILVKNFQRTSRNYGILDMDYEMFNNNTDWVNFHYVTFKNWGKARGSVKRLELVGCPLLRKNQLKPQRLHFKQSRMDLSVTPESTEELFLYDGIDIICSEPLQLPNLKSLKLEARENNLSLLTTFANCENLTKIVISRLSTSDQPIIFNARDIPRKVNFLKLKCLQIEFVQDDYIWEFSSGTLILNDSEHKMSRFKDCAKITSKIRAETLVVVCYRHMMVDTKYIMKLVLKNKQAKTIVIGSNSDICNWRGRVPFEESELVKHVDKKSNYYEFKNQIGRAITRTEFMKWF